MSSSLDWQMFRNIQSIPPLKTFCIHPLCTILTASALVQTPLPSSPLAYFITLLSDHFMVH